MKFSTLASLLVSISLGYGGVNANDSSISLRGSVEKNRRALRVQNPCTLVRVETHYAEEEDTEEQLDRSRERIYNGWRNSGRRNRNLHGGNGEDIIKCELQEEDRAAVGKYFVNVNGIESGQLENIVSGDTTLISNEAMIMDGEMWLPAGAAIEFGSNGENDRRKLNSSLRQEGIKKVLVVRADAQGSSTSASKEILSDKIFGTYGDTATLKSQYLGCSHGKLELQPFVGMTQGGTYIESGVLDVTVDNYIPGAPRFEIEDALEEAANQLVGRLNQQFDHVMLCLPPGTTTDGISRGWIAYGYVNSWLSVYNDDFCESMSTQVHEIGHNLGLAHSAKDGVSYGDKSGMMGYSYNSDNGPLQCFNPAKTYQLGWFNDKTIEVDPNSGTWVGTVIGAADYSNSIVDRNANVIVKIRTGGSKDLFLGYNRKKGANAGVPLAGDRITIVEQGSGYSNSDFLASLSLEEESTKTFTNFGGSGKNLVVEFMERGTRLDEAVVAIYFDTCVYPTCCEGPMCSWLVRPVVPAPVQVQLMSPTLAPTFPEPTAAPTFPDPTAAPTFPEPTAAPTPEPTAAPTFPEPTPAPTTRAPTLAPTREQTFEIEYNSNQNQNTIPRVPKALLIENFRDNLGVFTGGGDQVQQTLYQYILTARFQLNDAGNLPSLTTTLDLQGTSDIQVSFWYSAGNLPNNEGFKLQFSNDHGNSWSDIKSFKFGENGFDVTDKWNFANRETFQVTRGMSTTQLRFVADATTNDSDSVFYIAGVTVYGE